MKTVTARLWSIFDRTLDVMAFIAGILCIGMMLVVTTNVVARYVFNSPITMALEFTEFSLMYMTFLVCAWVLKRERHVSMDYLVSRLRPNAKSVFYIITSLIGAAISAAILWASIDTTIVSFQRKAMVSGTDIPIFTLFLIIPFAALMLLMQFLRRAYNYGKNFGQDITINNDVKFTD